jgi:monovalent cation:H+ antiporter-2, CPA2 family
VEISRGLNSKMNIVARAENVEQIKALRKLGVNDVIQPELEAGLEVTRQTLLALNVAASDIKRFTDDVREEYYTPLYEQKAD